MEKAADLKKHLDEFLTGRTTEDNILNISEATMHIDDHSDYHSDKSPA